MKSIDVAAAIIRRGNTILTTQRGYGAFEGGWEFPGGKIEPGETPEQAVEREIREELQVTVVPERLLATVDYDYDAFHLHMYCFVCTMPDESLTLVEHHAARWVDAQTIDDVAWLPADVQVVEAIKRAGLV